MKAETTTQLNTKKQKTKTAKNNNNNKKKNETKTEAKHNKEDKKFVSPWFICHAPKNEVICYNC